jgi:hypothetical protein
VVKETETGQGLADGRIFATGVERCLDGSRVLLGDQKAHRRIVRRSTTTSRRRKAGSGIARIPGFPVAAWTDALNFGPSAATAASMSLKSLMSGRQSGFSLIIFS